MSTIHEITKLQHSKRKSPRLSEHKASVQSGHSRFKRW